MQIVTQQPDVIVLRFEIGEEVMIGLKQYCETEKIHGGSIEMIGAVSTVTLSFYDITNKVYTDAVREGGFEMLGVLGNISARDGSVVIHIHGSFSGQDFAAFGGHIKQMTVSVTCEAILRPVEGGLMRSKDEQTGLHLLNPTEA